MAEVVAIAVLTIVVIILFGLCCFYKEQCAINERAYERCAREIDDASVRFYKERSKVSKLEQKLKQIQRVSLEDTEFKLKDDT